MNGSNHYKEVLVVLDFDGFLIDSYKLIKLTFESFGLDIGDKERFTHRRKFLKYLGGGKELLSNLVSISLPKKKKIRETLTEVYMQQGTIYSVFIPIINHLIEAPRFHVGIISRNFTHSPGTTIRQVLKNSEINEQDLDFIIPVPIGAKKEDVLEAMQSRRYRHSLFGADEIGDFKAAIGTGYEAIIASYGFDNKNRLILKGGVPAEMVFDTPESLARHFGKRLRQINVNNDNQVEESCES